LEFEEEKTLPYGEVSELKKRGGKEGEYSQNQKTLVTRVISGQGIEVSTGKNPLRDQLKKKKTKGGKRKKGT